MFRRPRPSDGQLSAPAQQPLFQVDRPIHSRGTRTRDQLTRLIGAVMSARHDQIAEALGDVRRCSTSPVRSATARCPMLPSHWPASSRIGQWRDDEIVRRVHAMVTADMAGDAKAARRHLGSVETQARKAWQIRPWSPSLWCRTPTPHALPVALQKTRSPRASFAQEARNRRPRGHR